jgi:hypothetical protein
MGAPHVRLYDNDVVQVFRDGEWQDAEVEDFRTLRIEFEPQFLLAVTERTDREDGVDPETGGECADHRCVHPDGCEGYTCSECGWTCPGDPWFETWGVAF